MTLTWHAHRRPDQAARGLVPAPRTPADDVTEFGDMSLAPPSRRDRRRASAALRRADREWQRALDRAPTRASREELLLLRERGRG